jgi:hypothetical protein
MSSPPPDTHTDKQNPFILYIHTLKSSVFYFYFLFLFLTVLNKSTIEVNYIDSCKKPFSFFLIFLPLLSFLCFLCFRWFPFFLFHFFFFFCKYRNLHSPFRPLIIFSSQSFPLSTQTNREQ